MRAKAGLGRSGYPRLGAPVRFARVPSTTSSESVDLSLLTATMTFWWWPGLRDRLARWLYRTRWWLGVTPVQLIARRARKVLASDDRLWSLGAFGLRD